MRYDTYLKVQQLAKTFNTFNPFEIADMLGFKVVYRDIGTNLGFTQDFLGFTHIVLNEKLKDIPYRWPVMAHELGHGVEHTACAAWYTIGNLQKNSMEYQANMFACYDLSKLYEEQFDMLPEDFKALQMAYALPDEFYEFFTSSDIIN
ncbi:ImmA/IrrE family metallo-endopeptidase [Lactiplantibacillus paraxiangfangensis]|uniref:ImmA/IrrE family metallo-endopeptidase n=1 Tax=Lactiplantibacillus paraxiangfangensis TaxID=3076224 RepID=UPI0030C6D4F8